MPNNQLRKRWAAEFFGTLFFVFLGAGSVVAAWAFGLPGFFSLLIIALGNGLGLGLAISATMGTSGGHLNPAVTIGALLANKIRWKDALAYIFAQVAGATVGAALLYGFFPTAIIGITSLGAPSLADFVSVPQAIFIEGVLTFFLVFAVFGTIIDGRAPKIAGFGVGLTVFLDVLVGGPLTGAAMNPARALGPAIASLSFANWYVYWIGPIIGGAIAALVYTRWIMAKK